MTANPALPRVSVVIPTHNPRMDYLRRVLEALRGQTLAKDLWELVIIDNGSREALAVAGSQSSVGSKRENGIELGWHPHARIVREEELGLTFARLRGFAEARGELIVMVDDDNVLAPDYLETAVRIAREHPMLGAFGGKCLPEFEVEPEEWLASVTSGLGLRDLGEAPQLFPEETGERSVSAGQCFGEAEGRRHDAGGRRPDDGGQTPEEGERIANHRTTEPRLSETALRQTPKHRVTRRVTEFPDCAPIGAGMVLRREAAAAYAERIRQRAGGKRHTADGEDGVSVTRCFSRTVGSPDLPKYRKTETPNHRAASVITDRHGDSLASGGDNDICLTVIEEGWQVGYLPQLKLTHLIPKGRMTLDYHKRMARDSMKSFVLMLDQHGLRPWPAMPKWTLPMRVASNWLRVKPWQSPDQSISWWGNIGMYEGRAALPRAGNGR